MAKPFFTNQQVIGQIDSGTQWSGSQLTYGFLQSSPSWDIGYEGDGFSAFTSYQAAATRNVMSLWDDLIAPSIVEQTSNQQNANVTFGNTTTSISYAHAYVPGNYSWAGEVWLNAQTYTGLYSPDPGDYYFMTILHEAGHAIGLNHPGSYNGGSPTYANDAEYVQDTHQWSVMSYFSASNTGADWNGGSGWQYAQTPMVHDILTVQAIYGADQTTRTGDTTYGFNSNAGNALFDFSQNQSPVLTIYDAGGTDTLDLSGFSQRAIINLQPGTYSSAGGTSSSMTYNIGIANNSWIENAIGGSGNDVITGNSRNNVLNGRGGNDTLFGGAGNDTLYGGAGNDTLNAGPGNDTLSGGGGRDLFVFQDGGGSNTISDFTAGAGTNDVIDVTAFGLFNFSGVLGAATDDGTNTTIALDGNDSIVLLNVLSQGLAADDFVYANAPPSNETLYGGVGNDLLSGGNGHDRLYGRDGNDRLYGQIGNDLLYGQNNNDFLYGGAGNDRQYGGNGHDRLYGQDGNDRLYGQDGNDRLYGQNGNDLLYGQNGNDFLYDQNGNDRLYGGAGNDRLYGGAGRDHLSGQDGYDRLYGGNGNDRLLGGNGNDRLYGQNNNDRLYGQNGNDLLHDQNGNDLLYGGAGNDRLYGGAGNDRLYGQDGDDRLYGQNGNDRLDGGAGNDRLYGGNGIDRLYGGNGNDRLIGQNGNDRLYGQNGNDRLDGGAGNDHLYGGGGDDLFVFHNTGGKNTIIDFAAGAGINDVIDIRAFGFATFADVQDAAMDAGMHMTIQLDANDSVTLLGVNIIDLHANDFII